MSQWSPWKRFLHRRTFIVDRSLQFRIILRVSGYAVFMITMIIIGLLLPLIVSLQSKSLDEVRRFETASVMLYIHSNFWYVALLSLVVSVIGAVQISHRIAGPLVRFRLALKQLADGEAPGPVRLRRGDFLGTECELLNALIAANARRHVEQDEDNRELTATADRHSAPDDEVDDAELRDSANQTVRG